MTTMKFLAPLLLSLPLRLLLFLPVAASQVVIPPEAYGAYCTAILGWYDSCSMPPDVPIGSNLTEYPTMCDKAAYTELKDPVFIDLTSCYVNPKNNERAVSFWGETPDKSRILEFHMIFDNMTTPLKPTSCTSDGVCECPSGLLKLKKEFLAKGYCDGTDDYSCLSEEFWGDSDECFVPATELWGKPPNEIYCSMIAKVDQFGPCDTYLDIPDYAYDTHCTAVTGWYNKCAPLDDDMCDIGDFTPLDEPMFFDLTTCYSNPYLDPHSVTFFFRGTDKIIKEVHLTFSSKAGDEYKAINCKSTGACECTRELRDLKAEFIVANGCTKSSSYSCSIADFWGNTDRCYVPATADFGDDGFFCSMTAKVEQFEPCDKSAVTGGITSVYAPTSPPTTPPPTPAPVPPTPVPTIALPASVKDIDIPNAAHGAFCTAIVGWYDSCRLPPQDDNGNDIGTMCSNADYIPLPTPTFIDVTKCYANPHNNGRSVSFWAETPDKSKVLEFHMIFDSLTNSLIPTNCDEYGVCECPSALNDLKNKFLAKEYCNSSDEYSCVSEEFFGDTDDCFVPATELWGAPPDEIWCSMVAKVVQLGPCENFVEIPDTAYDLYCTAITGWYTACDPSASEEDAMCDAGEFEPLDDLLFLDLTSCFSNPFINPHSVSFFFRGTDDIMKEVHLTFSSKAGNEYKPVNCKSNGACECTRELRDLKAEFIVANKCKSSSTYSCVMSDFWGGTDRCYVPATADFGDDGTFCSMTARLEQFEPCDHTLMDGVTSVFAPTGPPTTPAPTPAPVPPTPGPTIPLPESAKSMDVPDAAVGAYCTGIVGWYDNCKLPEVDDNGNDIGTMCSDATYIPLEIPAFIDLKSCYSNPHSNGRSVSFWGETPDKSRILEFHMIFFNMTTPYRPTNCAENGVCECPSALVDLKKQFLAKGFCDDNDDYSCLSEDFFGDTDQCFVPATELWGAPPDEIWCSMVAKVDQFVPCDTYLDIPDYAYETHCTAITGWYNKCAPLDDDMCDAGDFTPLDTPLFFDLTTCYSNPYLDPHSVTFFFKGKDNIIKEVHLTFSAKAGDQYKAINCKTTGACECTRELRDLRDEFIVAGGCTMSSTYSCLSEDFWGDTDRCFVPATADFGDDGYFCSLTARVEQFGPCDESLATPTSSTSIASSPTSVPPPTPSSPGDSGSTPIAQQPDGLELYTNDDDLPIIDSNVVIPANAHGAYCTAIEGWYNSCENIGAFDDQGSFCDNSKFVPLSKPLFIDTVHCYSNPVLNLGKRSVSFFGELPDKSKIIEFHLIFEKNITEPYGPLICNDQGLCECTPTLLALKKQFLASGGCEADDDFSCLSEDFYGDTDQCFVPATMMEGTGEKDVICSMVAKIQQYGPCDTVLDIPTPAYDAYCTGITGWYDSCAPITVGGNRCGDAGFNAIEGKPLFIDLKTCYSNPEMDDGVISFYGTDSKSVVQQYHVHFITTEARTKYAPKSCEDDGSCVCGSALEGLKKKFLNGECKATDEYHCMTAPFKGANDRCYIPDTDNDGVCAMVARTEMFGPCKKSANNGSTKSTSIDKTGLTAGISVIGVVFILSFCYAIWYFNKRGVFSMKYSYGPAFQEPRKLPQLGDDDDDEDDVIFVKRGNRYRDNPEDDGDGVWKREHSRPARNLLDIQLT